MFYDLKLLVKFVIQVFAKTSLVGTEENKDETTIIMGGSKCENAVGITRHDRGLDDRGF